MKNDTAAVFTVEPEGWRQMNAGRPAAHLVREAVQNVFDEAATLLSVDLSWSPDAGVSFVITDNVPGGIRDERLIWTIWLSDKVDSPTKRGRMGRGLKELISVSDETLIVTAGGPAIEFKRARGKWARTHPRKVRPAAGTRVHGLVKSWGKRDMLAIESYLRRMRPPEGMSFVVNGIAVTRQVSVESYSFKLPTVVFELQEDGGRAEREPRKDTTVDLIHEEEPWVYEMGIPIEQIDFPLSIDVGQRVPLREKRDVLTDPYRRELFAKLLNARVAAGLVPTAALKDNHVMIASQAPEHLSTATKQTIANAWTEGRAYATTPDAMRAATGMHVPVVSLRALPESIRGIAREVGKDVREVINEMGIASTSTIDPQDYTNEHDAFVRIWEWIAAGINRGCSVHLCTGRPSAAASFQRETRSLTVYVENVGAAIVCAPLGARALSLLIHELGHWKISGDDAHGSGFHSDVEDVGGDIAAFLLRHAAEAALAGLGHSRSGTLGEAKTNQHRGSNK